MRIVVPILLGLCLVPTFSQPMCAQQTLQTAAPSVATDQIKSGVEAFPSLLRQPYTLGLEMGYPSSVSCSPDSLRVIAGNQDNTARLWDVPAKSRGEVQIWHMAE